MKVGVVGASGYTGTELLRLCAAHPELEVAVVTAATHAGEPVAAHVPALAAAYPDLVYRPTGPEELDGLDLVFFGLPHGESQRLVPEVAGRVGAVVDLAADFRLQDPTQYEQWYGEAHAAPELLARFAYGLPELNRAALAGATLVAAPGCYPTAAALALAPFVTAGAVQTTGIVVDAASGVSGAGRSATDRLSFGTVDESFTAYGLLHHRHTPEIEQTLGAQVLFTPHLAHGPGHPGHLLRPAGPPPLERRRPRPLARGQRRRALCRRDRRAARHQGHYRVELRAGHGPGGRADRLAARPLGPRQPGEGGVGPGGAVRQPGPGPTRDDRPADGRSLPVSRDSGEVPPWA